MADYSALGLNSRLQAETSPITKSQFTGGYDFESMFEVQSNRIRTSKINIENMFRRSGLSSGTASFASGTAITIAVTNSFESPNQSKPMFGIVYTSIWEGVSLSDAYMLYPYRGNSVVGTYSVQWDYDYGYWLGATSLKKRGEIFKTGGTSSQVITFGADILYLDYVSGVSQ